jgi:hypothetical protein
VGTVALWGSCAGEEQVCWRGCWVASSINATWKRSDATIIPSTKPLRMMRAPTAWQAFEPHNELQRRQRFKNVCPTYNHYIIPSQINSPYLQSKHSYCASPSQYSHRMS